jgi:acyl-CoA thioester hydrolase
VRHLYLCPMRWADLDLLGHVNNVVYVDYLQEARVDMMRTHAPDARADDLAEGVVVVRHEVSYRAPLTFRFRPVSIECWVTEIRAASFTMAYEIFDEDDAGERTTYLSARTVLTPYVFATERPRRLRPEEKDALQRFLEPDESSARRARADDVRRPEAGHYPVHVRFSDVDVYGHVNNVKYFEYLQESRIPLLARLGRDVGGTAPDVRMVVAQTDVDYRVPILFREQPYDSWTWVSHVGRTSIVFETALCDGDTVLSRARVVGVFWDPATGRPAEPPVDFRSALVAAMSP